MGMEKKRKRPRDINEMAASIVKDATDPEAPTDDGKNPHAVALGRLGGKKGGKARAKKLSPEERAEISRIAARARWHKKKEGDQLS